MFGQRVVFILGLGAAALTLPAQAPAPAANQPTFRSRTDLVIVPVVVTKDGKHVEKLSKSAFTLLEDKVVREIAGFEEVKLEGRAPIAPKLGPGVFSNAPAVERPQHITVVLLDLINLPPPQKTGYSREALVKFLLGRPRADELVMLAALTPGGLKVIHNVTQDPRDLAAALRAVQSKLPELDPVDSGRMADSVRDAAAAASAARNEGVANPAEVDRMTELLTSIPEYFSIRLQREKTQKTLHQMRQLADALRGIPGRKSLIWVTGGMDAYGPPTRSAADRTVVNDYYRDDRPGAVLRGSAMSIGLATNDLFERIWGFLSEANIAVYPIDLSDVIIPGFTDASFKLPQPLSSPLLKTQTMLGFSQYTGGSYCGNQVPLDKCLRAAVQDSAQYYLLSFYADSQTKPGFHKLQVKVDAPGVRIHARQGYTARPGTEAAADRSVEIAQTLVSPLDATGVLLAVHWRERPSPGGRGTFELFVDPRAIALDGDRLNHFKLSLAVATVAPGGDPVGNLAKTIEATLSPEALKKVQSTGVLYRDSISLPEGVETVRFVIRDEISGRVGSVTAPLK